MGGRMAVYGCNMGSNLITSKLQTLLVHKKMYATEIFLKTINLYLSRMFSKSFTAFKSFTGATAVDEEVSTSNCSLYSKGLYRATEQQ